MTVSSDYRDYRTGQHDRPCDEQRDHGGAEATPLPFERFVICRIEVEASAQQRQPGDHDFFSEVTALKGVRVDGTAGSRSEGKDREYSSKE
jgi:hypothetical protein